VNPSRNVFLVGMMGAGKTTVGRSIARALGRQFHDTDQEVEARTGVRIAVIFDIEGEAGFRRRESEVLEHMAAMDGIVLATGGGAILDPKNRETLRSRGCILYLHALPNDLWLRLRQDKSRPLLQTENPLARLQELYALRDPLYREVADLVIDTGRQNISTLLAQVLAGLEETCKLSA